MAFQYIKIKDGDISLNVPVEDGTVSLALIKKYFPETVSLTYRIDDTVYAVKCLTEDDDKIQIIPHITEYYVFKHQENSSQTYLSKAKDKKIQEIMAIVDKSNASKGTCESFITKGCTKQVIVGWKKYDYLKSRYKQVLNSTGGNKVLQLRKSEAISYDRLLNLALDVMKNEKNSTYFKKAIVQLGNFKDDVYPKFNDFWKFAKQIKASNREIRIYLLTKGEESDLEAKLENNSTPSTSKNRICEETITDKILSTHQVSLNNQLHNKINLFINQYEKKDTSQSVLSSKVDQSSKQDANKENKVNEKVTSAKVISVLESSAQNLNDNKTCIKYYVDTNSLSQTVKIVTNATSEHDLRTFTIQELQIAVPVINPDDIYISSVVLGSGAYGCVNRGNWLGTDVAVKRINLSINNKYILREIKLMNDLRHGNLTSIMAVMLTNYSAYIVMELLDGLNLRSILYKSEYKEKYPLQPDIKNWISFQISMAINFLHERKIIHKDIKPDNIVVNQRFDLKLCDLGLSSIETMPPSLQTTLGHNRVGTVPYMAPEILLLMQPATAKSDIWSLACTLIEIYREMYVWGIEILTNRDLLTLTLESEEKPDVSLCPVILQSIIITCFERDASQRPKANTLMDLLRCVTKKPA